jgi:hypothetical protein
MSQGIELIEDRGQLSAFFREPIGHLWRNGLFLMSIDDLGFLQSPQSFR